MGLAVLSARSDEAVGRMLMRADLLDDSSFDREARAATPRLFRLAARLLGNTRDAEDLVQEALVRAYLMMTERKFDERASLGTWLHRVVLNLALDQMRSQRRWRTGDVMPDIEAHAHGEAQLEARLALRQLAQVLEELTPEQRTVVVLKDVEGYQTPEIAALLDVTEGAVEQRLVRARSLLRKRFAHE